MDKQQLEQLSDFELSADVLMVKYGAEIIDNIKEVKNSTATCYIKCEKSGAEKIWFNINNWSDMGPLIDDNKIEVQFTGDKYTAIHWYGDNDEDIYTSGMQKTYLRAAAIVYLLMQEGV